MTPEEIEKVYEALARTLDSVAASDRQLYLAKLALLLANLSSDAAPVLRTIEDACTSLDPVE